MAKVWSQGDVVRAVALYDGGLSLEAVAERLGSTDYTVAARLRSAGVSIRPCSQPKLDDEQREQVKRLFQQGESITAIARCYGVSRATVLNFLRLALPAEYAERQAQTRQSTADRLAEQENVVLVLISQQGRASRLEISQATGISYSTVMMVIRRLLADRAIQRVGQGRATAYRAV